MIWYRDSVVDWGVGLKYEMAASLVNDSVAEVTNKHLGKGGAAEVPWDSHANVNISSRTK